MSWPFSRKNRRAVNWLTAESTRKDLIEGLSGLFGGYFHEDFDMEAPTHEGVGRKFVQESAASHVAQTLGFLDALVEIDWTDEQLRSVMLEAGSYLDVALIDMSPQDWIKMLRTAISEELATKIRDAHTGT